MLIDNLHNDLLSFYNNNYKIYNLANPLFYRNDNELSWTNHMSDPRDNDYEIEYAWIVKNLQYSLSIDDKGLFQFFYSTKNDVLEKANVMFLPNPDISHQYIRFDFSPCDSNTYYHPEIHFHFGYPSSSMRIALEKIPYPSNFILFVIHLIGIQEITNFDKKNFVILGSQKTKNHFLTFSEIAPSK
jgi:hypothetical protein